MLLLSAMMIIRVLLALALSSLVRIPSVLTQLFDSFELLLLLPQLFLLPLQLLLPLLLLPHVVFLLLLD